MRLLLSIFLLATTASFASAHQPNFDPPGTEGLKKFYDPHYHLVWEVKDQTGEYEFEVWNVHRTHEGNVFDFSLSNENHTEGTVHVTMDALRNSMTPFNQLEAGDVVLNNQTSIWFSQKAFKELSEGSTTININGEEITLRKVGIEPFEIEQEGQVWIPNVLVAEADNGWQFKINNFKKDPVIFYMNIGPEFTAKRIWIDHN